MVSVFLIGPQGCGKSTLVVEYQKRHRKIQVINKVWYQRDSESLQETVDIQVKEEKNLQSQPFVSRGSIVDILVQAIHKNKVRVPNHLSRLDGKQATNLASQIFHGNAKRKANLVKETLLGYRQSLNVLVHSFFEHKAGSNIEDDIISQYQTVLRLLGIPYIELKDVELKARVEFIRQAINGIYPSPLASLKYYEVLSTKAKVKKGKQDDAKKETKQDLLNSFYESFNLPFYMVQANRSTPSSEKYPIVPASSQYVLKCLKINEETVEQNIEEIQDGKINRFLLQRGGSQDLTLLHFDMTVSSSVVFEILKGGVYIQGELYSFLGCSASGLKARKCYALKGTPQTANEERQKYGDFAALKTISKQIARFSLLLTNVVPTTVIPTHIKSENDVELRNGSNFTDGCGGISPDLADKLYQESKKMLRRKKDRAFRAPSVFQIRYQGYKGIVTRNSALPRQTIVVRPSMKKFQTNKFPHVCVCDYSRPFSYGHLNRQYIMLLSGLGIADAVFEDIQRENFARIEMMTSDRDSAMMILEWRHRSKEFIEAYGEDYSLFQEEEGMPPALDDLKEIQQQLIKESPKLKILVPESRTLFGVAETPRNGSSGGILQPGECMVRLTMHGDRQVSLHNQRVVVSKNPCYLLGDVRILRAVSSLERPELVDLERDLVDCIVFPIQGDRPHSEEIAGSDLDGDQYFVCWDKRLVPAVAEEPYHYPSYQQTIKKKHGEHSEELIRYFAGQNRVSSLTGRVNNLFRAWADLSGVTSPECIRLGQLFSRVVDSAKSGENVKIEEALIIAEESKPISNASSKYVWQRLEFAAQLFVDRQLKTGNVDAETTVAITDIDNSADPFEEDSFWLDLMSRNHLGMSEFTKFRLIMKYLKGDVSAFFCSKFSKYVNFGRFTPVERGFAVREQRVPASVMNNALRCYSRFVGWHGKFLEKYLLEDEVPWEFYWRGENERENAHFPSMIAHALRKNTEVLMIMQLPDSVAVLLRFSRKVMNAEPRALLFAESLSNGCHELGLQGFLSVNAIFLSNHFGYIEKYTLDDPTYKIDLFDRGLQLYRGQTGTTFVHVKVLQAHAIKGRGSQPKRVSSDDVEIPKLQISVDLTRFNRRMLVGSRPHPLVRKSPVFGIEIFVTNRKADHSSRASRISHLDILIEEGDPWTDSRFSPDKLLEDEKTDEMIIRGLLADAKAITAVILDLSSNTEHLSCGSSEWLAKFRSKALFPAHRMFGMATIVPHDFKDLIASVSTTVFSQIMSDCETSTAEKVLQAADFIAILLDLDIDMAGGVPDVAVLAADDCLQFLSTYIQLLSRWDFWMALKTPQRRKSILEWLESVVVYDWLDGRAHYAFRNACEQARVLLEELQDGSEATRSSSSISRISNLQMDADKEMLDKQKPIVSLFCVEAMPIGVRFTTGEYVFISRQATPGISIEQKQENRPPSSRDYEQEFPPLSAARRDRPIQHDSDKLIAKRSGYCFGRIVSVSDAPFCVKIKLESPSYIQYPGAPELIVQCLRQRACIYLELSMIPANVVTHCRNMNAIKALLGSKPGSALFVSPEIIPYLSKTETEYEETELFPEKEFHRAHDLSSLNDRQQQAVSQSLRNRVSLVHGPPGTGKSTTAIHTIKALLTTTNHRVLVCAETNLAVDNLALKLIGIGHLPHGQVVRVGGTDKVHPDLRSIHLESLVKGLKPSKKSPYFAADRNFFLSKYKTIIGNVLRVARVVFTTCAGAGDPNLNGQTFESVLMDEASMTTEPGALCPLAHGCRHLVLIGDHKQLGPHALRGECVSLFQRLVLTNESSQSSRPAAVTMLNQQHRMHPKLCHFPSNAFYNGELLTAPGIAEARTLPHKFFGSSLVRFVQVKNGTEQRQQKNSSWYNEAEAKVVIDIVNQLLDTPHAIQTHQITILTLYRAQQAKIQDLLLQNSVENIEVCCVDGFQGRENEVIVVSSVRCGPSLGFCDDPQRINVLLTRAKRGLVVVGDRATLSKSSTWAKWLRQASTVANAKKGDLLLS